MNGYEATKKYGDNKYHLTRMTPHAMAHRQRSELFQSSSSLVIFNLPLLLAQRTTMTNV
jgi:hypothetical protein